MAAKQRAWDDVAVYVRAALALSRNTLRHPFPRDWLGDALTAIAQNGPPPLADSLLIATTARRPAWAAPYELRAIAALRAGRCDEAADQLVILVEFGIERPDGPALVGRCRRGLAP